MHCNKIFFSLFFILSISLTSGCGKKEFSASTPNQVKTTEKPAKVTLAWDGSFSSPGVLDPSVTGYRVHYGTSPRDYTEVVNAGLSYKITLENLPRKKLYFALTAYNAAGAESEYSEEVSADLSDTSKEAGEVSFK